MSSLKSKEVLVRPHTRNQAAFQSLHLSNAIKPVRRHQCFHCASWTQRFWTYELLTFWCH